MAAMAVKEESLHHATENLILPTPRKYYRANIDTSHWQLRSLISSPEQDVIYFPNGSDIFSINTRTRERELVASLSFLPRCLVASKEWVCCGGDHGNYSSISLKEKSTSPDLASFLDADPDSRLPLDLDPTRRSTPQEYTARLRDNWRSTRPTAESTKVGTEIVNCITIWSPKDDPSCGAHKAPVAVVSNNDCTVSILDLATSEVLEKLTLPDFVNRSAISPDGELLVAICDDPFLYVYKRKMKAMEREPFRSKPTPTYEWADIGRIQLESQRQADRSQMRGSFALSFSISGKYLAVATQYGIISVFDTECLIQAQALMVSFTTSRPGLQSGAVRAMEFSPGPYDLLAWTESSGRVGIADVRTLFNSRQLILINASDEKVERVLTLDRSGQHFGLGSSRTESPSSSTPDYIGLDLERRQLRSLTREMLDRHQTPLTVEELEVLQAHRIQRRQRDAANAAREALAAEGSGTSRWGPWAEGRRFAAANRDLDYGITRPLVTTNGLPTALREFVNPERSGNASFRAFIDERNRENARRNQLAQESPRRRSSMLLAAAETAIEREAMGTPRSDNDTSSRLEGLSLAPGRQASPLTDSPRAPESNTPWAEIESVYRSQLDRTLDRSTRLRVEVADDEQNISPGDFAHRLRQPWRPSMDDAGIVGLGARDENGLLDGVLRPAETMGCCWSPDGKVLYAATLEGIHEYHVNVPARKKFPSVVYR